MSNKRQTPEDEAFYLIRTLAAGHGPGTAIGEHSHCWRQLIYAPRGVMTVSTEQGAWIVPPQWAVWVPAGIVHSIRFYGETWLRTLYIRPRVGRSLPRQCRVIRISALLGELVLRAVSLGMLDRRQPAHRRLAEMILEEFQEQEIAPLELPMPRDPAARRLADTLIEHPKVEVSVDELARRVGASRRTLERRFVQETGITLGRWRQQARLLYSLRRLAAGDAVQVAGEEAGYNSASAYIAAFRGALGTTPGRYFEVS
jgi:AraC-like DNA-binding protein